MVNNRMAIIGDSNDRFSTLSDRERFSSCAIKRANVWFCSMFRQLPFQTSSCAFLSRIPFPEVTRNKKVRWTGRDSTGEQIRTRTTRIEREKKKRERKRTTRIRGKKREEERKMDKERTKGVRMRGLERNQLESKGLKKKDAPRKNGLIEKKERRRKR